MLSICIATFNGELFIRKQLNSILSQLSDDDEIIISDNGSTDNTIKIINELGDNRIKLFYYKKIYNNSHQNVTYNFENSLLNAKGDHIFLSDQDDIWLPNKIEQCLNILKNYDFIYTNYHLINEYDEIIKTNSYKRKKLSHINIFCKPPFHGCTLCFNKNILNKILPFPKNIYSHDYWIGTIAFFYYKCYYLNESLIMYRIHNSNVSHGFKKKYNLFYKLYYRITNLFNVLFRGIND